MKKTTFNLTIFFLITSLNLIGQPNPVTIDITAAANATVCAKNIQLVRNIDNLPSNQFSLGILLEIVDASGAVLTSPAVQCNASGGVGYNCNRFNFSRCQFYKLLCYRHIV